MIPGRDEPILPDPGMTASASGMRAKDAGEMDVGRVARQSNILRETVNAYRAARASLDAAVREKFPVASYVRTRTHIVGRVHGYCQEPDCIGLVLEHRDVRFFFVDEITVAERPYWDQPGKVAGPTGEVADAEDAEIIEKDEPRATPDFERKPGRRP